MATKAISHKPLLDPLLSALTNPPSSPPTPRVPFIAGHIVTAEKPLYSHVSGESVPGTPHTLQDRYWLASLSKLITAIAALQLVEKGLLALDDPYMIAKYAPELVELPVLKGWTEDKTPEYEPIAPGHEITLRMLLTHTAGLAYPVFTPESFRLAAALQEGKPAPEGPQDHYLSSFSLPLIYQPGTKWEYSPGLDWAGVIVQRASEEGSLEEYFQEHIFKPLGADISFFGGSLKGSSGSGILNCYIRPSSDPAESPASTVAPVNMGTHIQPTGALAKSREDCFDGWIESGGSGLYGSVGEYAKVLTELLVSGGDGKRPNKLLGSKGMELLYENGLPASHSSLATTPFTTAMPAISRHLDTLPGVPSPLPDGYTVQWAPAGLLLRRADGSRVLSWAGLGNCYWFIEVERGYAGVVGTQMLPFGDEAVLEMWEEVKKLVPQLIATE